MAEMYLATVHDKLTGFCSSCEQWRPVYVVTHDEGPHAFARLTCCCACQRILQVRPCEPGDWVQDGRHLLAREA